MEITKCSLVVAILLQLVTLHILWHIPWVFGTHAGACTVVRSVPVSLAEYQLCHHCEQFELLIVKYGQGMHKHYCSLSSK